VKISWLSCTFICHRWITLFLFSIPTASAYPKSSTFRLKFPLTAIIITIILVKVITSANAIPSGFSERAPFRRRSSLAIWRACSPVRVYLTLTIGSSPAILSARSTRLAPPTLRRWGVQVLFVTLVGGIINFTKSLKHTKEKH